MSLITQGLGTSDFILGGLTAGVQRSNFLLRGLNSPYLLTDGMIANVPSPTFTSGKRNVIHVGESGGCSCYPFYKYVAEQVPLDFDVSGELDDGIIVTEVVSFTAVAGLYLMSTNPPLAFSGVIISDIPTTYRDTGTTAQTGQVVQVTLSGGVPATAYAVQMIYNSNDGAVREANGTVIVLTPGGVCCN